jgi:hypothetical protein
MVQALRDYAQSGPLSGLVFDPPPFFTSRNGVLGVALSYDDLLVSMVARVLAGSGRPQPHSTVEFSSLVARVLAGFARGDDGEYGYILHKWKKYSSWGEMSPIVVEITVGLDFPRLSLERDFRDYTFFAGHRVVFRRVKRSTLQYAEAGGRFLAGKRDGRIRTDLPRWGTLGGFVEAERDGTLYAMTAAHVADQIYGYGTPSFAATEGLLGLRAALQSLTCQPSRLIPVRWRGQRGELTNFSPADFIEPFECRATYVPATSGLDVALAKWPQDHRHLLSRIATVSTDQLTQELPIYFIGARSGSREVFISNYSIWHTYKMPRTGLFACVSDCLQIKVRDVYDHGEVSKGGDSGAWLIADGQNEQHWVGVLVGGDGDRAGIVPASRIVAHFNNEIGPLHPMI